MDDKRTNSRYKVCKTAVLYTADEQALHCLVTDLSVGGACVSLHELSRSVAETIGLLMTDECLLYPCQVRWQIDCHVGIRFTGQPELVGPLSAEVTEAHTESVLFEPSGE